jgi:hypothetical protein
MYIVKGFIQQAVEGVLKMLSLNLSGHISPVFLIQQHKGGKTKGLQNGAR